MARTYHCLPTDLLRLSEADFTIVACCWREGMAEENQAQERQRVETERRIEKAAKGRR